MAEKEIDVLATEEYEIEMEEVLPPVVTEGGTMNHALLNNREKPNQHPIIAIEGLREELDDIRALKENFSNKYGHANYYLWDDGGGEIDERVGYFVSACDGDCSKITVYNRGTILGVSVDTAAFIGNRADSIQTKCNVCGNIMEGHWVTCANPECESTNVDYIRKKEYGLVATSGVVSVRCENDVIQADYVMPNANGVAAKVDNKYGYQVIEVDKQLGVPYAAIDLDATTSSVYGLGVEVEKIEGRVTVNEKNVVSAINVANQAYNKSQEAATSSSVSEEAVKKALESILDSEKKIEAFEKAVESASSTSAQARAIAESAVTSADAIRKEAVDEANKALAETSELRKDLESMGEGIHEIENQISIIVTENSDQGTAIAGIRTEVSDHESKINSLTSWQGDTNVAMARIEQKADANGAYIQSTVANMDKYSVGPYSQAYGFTLEQATSILEEGMIYVPTENKLDDDKEVYVYEDADGNSQTYEREFSKGYLYRWGKLEIGLCGWITVDKDYSEDKLNTSAPAVYFATEPPSVSGDFGYWYTNGDTVSEGYEPYTLYKWEKPEDEEGYWFAVATLAGNSSNRAVSQIRQDSNSIELSVTNLEGSYAGMKATLDETSAKVNSIAAWPSDAGENKYNMAILKQHSDGNSSHLALAAIRNVEGTDEYEIDELGGAKIVLADTEDGGSYIQMDADKINFTANDYKVIANNISLDASQITLNGEATFTTTEEDGTTKIDGGNIAAGSITAEQINVDNLIATGGIAVKSDVPTDEQITTITNATIETTNVLANNLQVNAGNIKDLTADKMTVTDLNAFGATIGGWSIDEDRIYKAGIGLSANQSKYLRPSLVKEWTDSPIRFYAGNLSQTMSSQVKKTINFTPSKKGELLTETFEENYRIANARCLTETVTHASDASTLIDITLTKNELLYEGEVEVVLFPAWVLADHILDGTLIAEEFYLVGSGVGVGLTVTYIGSGKVKITAQKFATMTDPLTLSVSVRVAGSYSFVETLDVDVKFVDKIITVNFIPQTTEEYNIDIEYHRDENSNLQKFSVLEDGSLYASAAEIEGNITATSGQIGGCSIEDGVLQIKNANADNLEFKRGTVGDWYLGKTEIPISGTESLQDIYALYSREMAEKRPDNDGRERSYTYRVYLTPKGVYVAGRYDTSNESAVPYYANKTWLDICES